VVAAEVKTKTRQGIHLMKNLIKNCAHAPAHPPFRRPFRQALATLFSSSAVLV